LYKRIIARATELIDPWIVKSNAVYNAKSEERIYNKMIFICRADQAVKYLRDVSLNEFLLLRHGR